MAQADSGQRVQTAIARARRSGDRAAVRELRQQLRSMPNGDSKDPGYRRLRYLRYADLCRTRHKSHYAEYRIMPSVVVKVLVSGVAAAGCSA